jgi:sugar phosphate isomerase/epimerase
MKLGIYSIVLPDYKRDDAAKLTCEIGYTGIEWTIGYPDKVFGDGEEWHVSLTNLEDDAPRAKEVADKYGLDIPSLGCSSDTGDFEKIGRLMKAAQVMGSPNIRVGSAWFKPELNYNDLFNKVVKDYETIQKMAADTGVRALIEIHHNSICESAAATLRIMEKFDPKYVGCIFDPGNMVHSGMENWRMGIQMLAPWIAHVHAKNCGWFQKEDGSWTAQDMSLEGGIANFRMVLQALKDINYQGYIDLEDFRGGYCVRPTGITTEQKMRESFEYQAKIISELQ